MKKIVKVLLVVFILFLIFNSFYNIYASDVNMNLSNGNDSTTYGSNTSTNSTSSTNKNSSVLVSSTPTTSLDGLTISDMINIVLCAIGLILVLLGVAIIIRQKSSI